MKTNTKKSTIKYPRNQRLNPRKSALCNISAIRVKKSAGSAFNEKGGKKLAIVLIIAAFCMMLLAGCSCLFIAPASVFFIGQESGETPGSTSPPPAGGELCTDNPDTSKATRVEKIKSKITRYYAPVPGQSYYFGGSYEKDKEINCGPGDCLVTADGSKTCFGTLAADRNRHPFGTAIYIPGISENFFNGKPGVVHDVGGAIKGNRLDVWMGIGMDGVNNVKNSPTPTDENGLTECTVYFFE